MGVGKDEDMLTGQETKPLAPIRTSIVIDSCAWNYLFDNEIDLSVNIPTGAISVVGDA
jgi:hypothetical protein